MAGAGNNLQFPDRVTSATQRRPEGANPLQCGSKIFVGTRWSESICVQHTHDAVGGAGASTRCWGASCNIG
eukprot:1665614-Amphidinium_carterae.1